MNIELNWATFRRLVQLELLIFPVLIPVALIEVLDPRYASFHIGFEKLAAEHDYRDAPDTVALALFLPVFCAYILSLVGMLRRNRTARSVYLGTFILGWPLTWLLLKPVTWSSPSSSFVMSIGTMMSGAIFLLAYSRDHGQVWFDSFRSE